MVRTMTPGERIVSFAALVAVCIASTLIVGRWPDSIHWVGGGMLVLVALVLFLAYRAARKATPRD